MTKPQPKTDCLACQAEGTCHPTKQIRRGLCDQHYQAFLREKQRLSALHSEAKIEAWEQKLIADGLLDGRTKKRGSASIFAAKFEEMEAESLGKHVAAEVSESYKKTKKPKPSSE